jgi:hypothetical protein
MSKERNKHIARLVLQGIHLAYRFLLGHNEFAHHKFKILPLEFGFTFQIRKLGTLRLISRIS